ncbi:MAG: hypothetical protein U1A77_18775 [Pirellulales bacterium]
MDEPKKPNPLPNFRKGAILRANQLVDCVDYMRWLESRILELERWREDFGRQHVPSIVALELAPKVLHWLAGVQVDYPYRIIATLSDGSTRDVTDQCSAEQESSTDSVFEIDHARKCFAPLHSGEGTIRVRCGTIENSERLRVFEFTKVQVKPISLFHSHDDPRLVSNKPGSFPACSFDVVIGSERIRSAFYGEDCGDTLVRQRFSDSLLHMWQAANKMRCFVVYVRCPQTEGAVLDILMNGEARMRTPPSLHISSSRQLVAEPKLVAFEGSAASIEFIGPPIVAYQELAI